MRRYDDNPALAGLHKEIAKDFLEPWLKGQLRLVDEDRPDLLRRKSGEDRQKGSKPGTLLDDRNALEGNLLPTWKSERG